VSNNWFLSSESIESKKSLSVGFIILSNIIASIYTYICFIKLLINWLA
jgi:hypothetical protein